MRAQAFFLSLLFLAPLAQAGNPQLEIGRGALHSLTGCFLVDYNYTETESLQPGYSRDARVYDVDKTKTVKEWIYADEISPQRIRIQHVLFATDAHGNLMKDSLLKHEAEDWEFNAPFLYEFTGPSTWQVKDLRRGGDPAWTRRITNLDDGLRYQCASEWKMEGSYPEWSCDTYAPIPGRETRDMGRKDYNTLARSNRLIVYGKSWLERQNNVKTQDKEGDRKPLAKEAGKNWYIRLPKEECESAREFAEARKGIWTLLRETWDEVLRGDRAFIEKSPDGQPPRYARMIELQENNRLADLTNSSVRQELKQAILKLIGDYRAN